MLGAVIGDILGSAYEGGCASRRDSPFFPFGSGLTDDTVCTVAVSQAIYDDADYAETLRRWGNKYPNAGYGGSFKNWLRSEDAGPYESFANGALMRVSPAVALSRSLDDALNCARQATAVTHNHPIALDAVDCYIKALWAAMKGASPAQVCSIIEAAGYTAHDVEIQHEQGAFCLRADETLSDVVSCLKQAHDFESLMRECLYHGGDTDTIAAIAGALGEALWGIPEDLVTKVRGYLPQEMFDVLLRQYAQMAQMAQFHPEAR